MSRTKPVLAALGDSAITVALADSPSREATAYARRFASRVRQAGISHLEEVLPAYTAVTIFYDALHLPYDELCARLQPLLVEDDSPPVDANTPCCHRIRVVYDGPDLADVAAATGLTTDEVVELHSSLTYDVDLLGFVPGFAYLSEIDARLELPRRAQPRQRVPAGSVAIASRLTGIYPFETPGGWHILGRTDAVMFDPRRAEPSLFHPGDTVKFERAQ